MNMGSSDSSSSSGGDAALNSPTATIGSGGSNGVTHTVVVAPTAGVLRFVPFAVEAAVGDTVEYVWGADLHTVTKGSALQLCNQSQDSATFNTGLQNHSFSYLQAVNDTKPTYFYCAHPGHCAKGMFGVINPLSSDDPALQAGSAQTMNATMMGSASTMSAMAYAQSVMANGTSPAANSLAAKWGASYSLADIPPAMHGAFVENVAFTRALIAMNPDLVQNGKLAMSTTGAPVMYPVDVAGAANAAANLAAAPAANAAAAAPSSSSAAAAATSSAAGKKNGARGLAAPAATVVFALAVSLLAL
jgi:plastocyanin